MVFWFTSVHDGKTYQLYMGRDKMENEELIKYGWDCDIWFHVNDLSSAHVYLRIHDENNDDSTAINFNEVDIKQIPPKVLEDCAQLTKANSIIGNKKETGKVKIVYTYWSNLLKTSKMEAGQVGYKEPKKLYFVDVLQRENAIINRLEKTRKEFDTKTIRESREQYDRAKKQRDKATKQAQAEEEKKMKELRLKEREERSYDKIMKPEEMTSNAEITQSAQEYEEDFM